MVEAVEALAAVRRAAAVNPLFALGTGPVPAGEAGWRPATDLADAEVAARLIAEVGAASGAPAARVSASMTVLGYSARLVAPTVAALLADGLLLDVAPDRVWWRYAAGDGFRLRLPEPSGSRAAPLSVGSAGATAAPRRWCEAVVDGHLAPVIRSVRAAVAVADRLVWGNVASSLAGALRVLALAEAVPLPACHDAGRALLGHGPLRGSGTLTIQSGQLRFARRSCCLYYRLPGGGLCGDCPLPAPPRVRTPL